MNIDDMNINNMNIDDMNIDNINIDEILSHNNMKEFIKKHCKIADICNGIILIIPKNIDIDNLSSKLDNEFKIIHYDIQNDVDNKRELHLNINNRKVEKEVQNASEKMRLKPSKIPIMKTSNIKYKKFGVHNICYMCNSKINESSKKLDENDEFITREYHNDLNIALMFLYQ